MAGKNENNGNSALEISTPQPPKISINFEGNLETSSNLDSISNDIANAVGILSTASGISPNVLINKILHSALFGGDSFPVLKLYRQILHSENQKKLAQELEQLEQVRSHKQRELLLLEQELKSRGQ